MQPFLDFLNNNAGLVAILGVIVGWALSSLTSLFLYQRQKKDDAEKEKKERYKHKAELLVNDYYCDYNNVRKLELISCTYVVTLDKDGFPLVSLPKEIVDTKNLKKEILYLENIGDSAINELEVAVSDTKNTALIGKKNAKTYLEKGLISYGISLDRKIKKSEALELIIYHKEDDFVDNSAFAPIVIFYRDSLNNVCEQALFVNGRNIYEPQSVDYSRWRSHVDVNKNLMLWEERLNRKS